MKTTGYTSSLNKAWLRDYIENCIGISRWSFEWNGDTLYFKDDVDFKIVQNHFRNVIRDMISMEATLAEYPPERWK